MQRWFPTFLPGRPGIGLLLMRLALVAGLVADALVRIGEPTIWHIVLALAESALGALLLIGLWTPIAGVVACLLELGLALSSDGAIEPALQRAVMSVCLTLIGPGIWSIDARLFGRRRVTIRSLHHF